MINTNNLHKKELKKAKKYAKSVGLTIDKYVRHTPGITIVLGDEITINSPIWFTIGEDKLIEIYHNVTALGITGKILIKAAVNAYYQLTDKMQTELRNSCWVMSHNPTEFIKFCWQFLISQIAIQKVSINPNKIGYGTTRNIYFSFGGYKGFRELCVLALEAGITEFERIYAAESKAAGLVIPTIRPASEYAEYNPCLTCKRCKITKDGFRICKDYRIHIDEDLTVKEVNDMYPTASIRNYGCLTSSFIVTNVGECDDYKNRIIRKSK